MQFELIDDYLSTVENTIARLGIPSRREKVGVSAKGSDILAYPLDGMPEDLLVLGFPHPNEPLSQVMVLRILDRAAELSSTGTGTWWLVPVWDVDGAHSNESWWAKPNGPTLFDAACGWFRPSARWQVEWDFPLAYEGYKHVTALSETAAIARLIERAAPRHLLSLHNGTIGSAYAYASGGRFDLAGSVSAVLVASGLGTLPFAPVPYVERLAEGVFTLPNARREIDFLKASGDFGPGYANGAASFEHVGQGCSSLVLELPLFTLDTGVDLGTPAELSERLDRLWLRFESDLASVFPLTLADPMADLLLSSPREFWERRASDAAVVRSIARQMSGWSSEEATERYLTLVFSLSTQYAQLERALGKQIGGSAECLTELARVSSATSLVDQEAVRRIADGVVDALVGR